MNGVALSIAYLPNIQYFTKLLAGKPVRLEACETYPKQSYRNRCEILGANGRLALSIPVLQILGNHTPIRQVEIDNSTAWQNQHWRAIQSAYSKSAYFDFVSDFIHPFYKQKFNNLWDFDRALLAAIMQFLEVKANISVTSTFELTPSAGFSDFRTQISPKVTWTNDPQFVATPYFQMFAHKFGFVPNLSIIDLLFNEGLNSLEIINLSIKNKDNQNQKM